MAVYYDEWKDYESVKRDYPQLPPEPQIVYAGYTYEDYSGSAIVVWRDENGQWWENHDGHGSCYGLEGWRPEQTLQDAVLAYKGWPGLVEAVEAVR